MDKYIIQKAEYGDLPEILELQYLAYQSEADLFKSRDIPPLKQTLDEVISEYQEGIILKVKIGSRMIGSVRAALKNDTVYIGKLMVHPDFRRMGIGKSCSWKWNIIFLKKDTSCLPVQEAKTILDYMRVWDINLSKKR